MSPLLAFVDAFEKGHVRASEPDMPIEGDGTTHQELTVDKLKRLIHEAGRVPVERDSLYRRVVRRDGDWSIDAA